MTNSSAILGLDLGQAADFSALAVLTLPGSDPQTAHPTGYACRALKRWRLGTAYPVIVAQLAAFIHTSRCAATTLVVDATGVGRPVVDQFLQAGLPALVVPVTITAGRRSTYAKRGWCVPKRVLINNLRMLLERRRLQFAAALPETAVLVRELQRQRVKIASPRHETYAPAGNEHDDLLLALALAAWWAEYGATNGRNERQSSPRFIS